MKDDYETAIYYFKLGNNREYYSKAYYGHRGNKLRQYFFIVAGVMVLLIGLLVWSEVRYFKKTNKKPAKV